MDWLCIVSGCMNYRLDVRTGVLTGWSFAATLCLLFALIQVAIFIRAIIITRRKWWIYLLMLIPLGMLTYSFIVTTNAFEQFTTQWAVIEHIHEASVLLRDEPNRLYKSALYAYQLQMFLAVTIFTTLLLIEKRALPPVRRVPLWVRAREHHFYQGLR